MKRFCRSFLALMHLLTFAGSAAIFFLSFGISFPFLLRPSRTSVITAATFAVVFLLIVQIYDGMEIGKKKSRQIILSYTITLLAVDLIVHLFLCVMNTTILHDGRFVYEKPLLLVLVYLLQILWITFLAYFGNGMYFRFNPPERCLIIRHPNEDVTELKNRIGKLKKQYRVEKVCDSTDVKLLHEIDDSDAVFLYNVSPAERTVLVEYCFKNRKEIYYNMELQDVVALGSHQVLFDDKPMIHYDVKGLTFEQRIIKRAMDILISGIGLLVTSPILLVTAVAIKLEDHGPVFYRQSRLTYAGREFSVLKFRSMRTEVGGIHRSVCKDDDRITRVGRFIRKFRIDELPQLINVIKSDMSLVGPRPEMVENAQKYSQELPAFAYRLRAKAGLTGLAQIYGKYNTSPADKLALDLTYIERFSIWLDIKLILRTVLVLLTPDDSTAAFEQKPKAEKEEEIKEVQRV